ncbi:MAG: bile acid:sodium symporter family protein [Pseudomonadota bacterium]
MDLLLDLFLPLSLAIIMFSLGLGLTAGDFARVALMPRAFFAGIAAQMAALPAVAFALLWLFPTTPELSLGVMILAFCPGGVTSNVLVKLGGGNLALSITLTAVASLLSVLTVPLLVDWMAEYFVGAGVLALDISGLAIAVFLITTLPVGIGVGLRFALPRLAEAIDQPLAAAAVIFFVLIVLGAIFAGREMLVENFRLLGPFLIGLNIVMLLLGFFLGWILGLGHRDRIAISMEAGVQNAALGITLGGLIAEGTGVLPGFTLPSAVYGVTMYLVVAPFIIWARRKS